MTPRRNLAARYKLIDISIQIDMANRSELLAARLRKRQRTEQHPFQLSGTSQPQSKRQKLSCHSAGSHPPPTFWDKLSKIWLTKDALSELDRRNRNTRARPVTRTYLAQLKRYRQFTQSSVNLPAPRTFKDINLFARHGGPDLTDLRGVCIVRDLSPGDKC